MILSFGLYMVGRIGGPPLPKGSLHSVGTRVAAYTCAAMTTSKTTTREAAKISAKATASASNSGCERSNRAGRLLLLMQLGARRGGYPCEGSSPSRFGHRGGCTICLQRPGAAVLSDTHGAADPAVRRCERDRHHRSAVRGSLDDALGQAGGGRESARRRRSGRASAPSSTHKTTIRCCSGRPAHFWSHLYEPGRGAI